MDEKYSWKDFFAFIRAMKPNKKLIIIGIFLSVMSAGLALYIPILLKNLIDNLSPSYVKESGILFFAVMVLQIIFSFFSGISLMTAGESLVRDIRNNVIRKVFDAPYTFFEKTGVERLSSHIINDSALLSNTITSDLNSLVSSIITIVGAVIILFMLDSGMMLMVLIILPLGLLILAPLMSIVSNVSNRMQTSIAKFNDQLISQFRTMSLIKTYGTKEFEENQSFKNTDSLFKLGIKEGKIQIIISPIISTVCLLMIIMILLVGIGKMNNNSLSTGTFAAFMLYTFQLISPVTTVGHVFSSASIAKGASSRINKLYYGVTPNEGKPANYVPNLEKAEITLKHVSYSGINSVKVLKDVNLRARKNKITAIVGPSGSGKTTIIKIISRLYKPTNGRLFLGKIDSKEININSWNTMIGTVFQDNILVKGSIRDNLLYGSKDKNISDSRLWNVLQEVSLNDFTYSLPNKLDTIVNGENGTQLSGGQKQRLCMARSIMYNPQILILDEPTSSLDERNEKIINHILKRLSKKMTIVVVTHKLATVLMSDYVYVVDDGRVKEFGKPEDIVNHINKSSHDHQANNIASFI